MSVMEYFRNLPPLALFILGLITVLGTSGFVTGIFAVWKIYAQVAVNRQAAKDAKDASESARLANESKMRMETQLSEQHQRIQTLELDKMRVEAEAKQSEAASENMQKLIEVVGAISDRFQVAVTSTNAQWQKVIDTKSDRELEADKIREETNRMFVDAVNRQTDTMKTNNETLVKLLGVEGVIKTAASTMESLARDNQSHLTNAIALSVSDRKAQEENLRTIMQRINELWEEERRQSTQNQQMRKQTITVIDTRFKELKQEIIDLFAVLKTQTAAPDDTIPLFDSTQADNPHDERGAQ